MSSKIHVILVEFFLVVCGFGFGGKVLIQLFLGMVDHVLHFIHTFVLSFIFFATNFTIFLERQY